MRTEKGGFPRLEPLAGAALGLRVGEPTVVDDALTPRSLVLPAVIKHDSVACPLNWEAYASTFGAGPDSNAVAVAVIHA